MPSGRQRIYLAYGSNLHPRRLEARVGPADILGTVALPGWQLRFDKRGGDGSAKANLRPCPGGAQTVHAALFALYPEQVGRLDVFEGCGRGYETFLMNVEHAGQELDVFTYLAPSQWRSDAVLPFDWYVDLIAAGARFHGFDESYIQQIARHSSRKDPDVNRARSALLGMRLPLRRPYRE
ncbi:gamma-glutamylcyclotransferase family protein [Wenzhouxiangella sp. EGI_FJ10305]|uniref:gamma-glutamylcyclotransferase family protein n=1 Tax=Wenzhouxiangella sp. EGI_FJ10305 TaxID=3243768 RepID=UPI0035E2FD46